MTRSESTGKRPMSNWVGPPVGELRCRSRHGVASHDTDEFRIHGSPTAVRLAAGAWAGCHWSLTVARETL